MITTIIIFLFRDGLGYSVPLFLILTVILISLLFLNVKELVYFYLFLIPLSVGNILYFVNAVFGLIFIVKFYKEINVKNTFIVGTILILWEALHLIPSVFLGFDENIVKLFGFSICLIVTIVIITSEKLHLNFIPLIFSWSLGLASLCGILFLKYANQYGLSNLTSSIRRFGYMSSQFDTSSTSLLINPNTLGKLVFLTVFCLLTVLVFEKKFRFLISFLIFYFIIFGIFTGSRSFLLISIILLIIYTIEMVIKIRKNIKVLLTMIITSLIIIFFVTNNMQDTLEMFSARIESDNITGSRDKIYKEYTDTLINSPNIIYGVGMQEYVTKYNAINNNIVSSSHNVFIEVIAIWGLLGMIIVCSLFITLYKSMKIKRNLIYKSFLPFLPLFGLFLSAQFGQFFISYYDTFPTLILTFINIKYADSKLREEKDL